VKPEIEGKMKGARLIMETTLRIADLAAKPCDVLCLMTAAPCLDTLLQAFCRAVERPLGLKTH